MQRIKDGSEDVILMVSKTQEREAFISFTPPIRNSRWVFFHLKEKDFEWTQWQDLKAYQIGYVTGNNVGKKFPAAAEKYNYTIEEVKADVFNARKLLLGRIDIALTDLEVMQRIIELNPEFQHKLDWYDRPVFESFYHLGISKKSFLDGVYQDLIDRVVVILVSNGFKTALVSVFIFLIFQYLVTRHLADISSHLENLSAAHLDVQLVLDRRPARDELSQVVSAINEMGASLSRTTISKNHVDNIVASIGDGLVVADPDAAMR